MNISQPIIIFIICLLLFMMIIRYRQATKINNIMEQFNNIENNIENNQNNIEKFDNKSQIMVELSPVFSNNYIEGHWTTRETELNKHDKPTNLMKINLEEKKIFLPKISNNTYLNGHQYNITYHKGMNIVASSTKTKYTLSINFINIATNPNYGSDKLIITTDVPLATVNFVDKNNNILYDFRSYKVDEHKKVTGQLKTIIKNKNYNSRIIEDKYKVNSYLEIVSNYKMAHDLIKFSYGVVTKDNSEFNSMYSKNIIKNSYNNILAFSISREFETPVGSTIKTHGSEIYKLEAIKNNNLPKDIIIKGIGKDRSNIDTKMYTPKSTIIYFYKISNSKQNYKFIGEDIKVNQQLMKYENGGNNMFNKNMKMNNIDGLTLEFNNTYTIIQFKTVFTPNLHSDIIVPFKDLFAVL